MNEPTEPEWKTRGDSPEDEPREDPDACPYCGLTWPCRCD